MLPVQSEANYINMFWAMSFLVNQSYTNCIVFPQFALISLINSSIYIFPFIWCNTNIRNVAEYTPAICSVCKDTHCWFLQNLKNYTLMTDVCCLSVSLNLSVSWCLSEGPDSSKYAGMNEAIMTCLFARSLIYSDWFLQLSAKPKPKSKPKSNPKQNQIPKCSCDFIVSSITRKRKE